MAVQDLPDIDDFMPLSDEVMGLFRPTDRFVVSFPRSGSNWLGAMITRCLSSLFDPETLEKVFILAYDRKPDLDNPLPYRMMLAQNVYFDRGRAESKRELIPPGKLVFRIHTWKSLQVRAPSIYLFRRAEDSLVSYYNFAVKENHIRPEEIGVDEYAIGNLPWWKAHLSEAVRRLKEEGEPLKFVPYENLCVETVAWLGGILRHLEIIVDEEVINSAVSASNLNNVMTHVLKNSVHLRGAPGQGEERFEAETLNMIRKGSEDLFEHAWEIAMTQQGSAGK